MTEVFLVITKEEKNHLQMKCPIYSYMKKEQRVLFFDLTVEETMKEFQIQLFFFLDSSIKFIKKSFI